MNKTWNKTCDYCGKEYQAKRKTSKFCSDKCRIYKMRDKNREFEEKKEADKLSEVEKRLGFKVDRTRAFTDEEMEKVRGLPRLMWLKAMERPISSETMTQAEIEKHYRNINYPEVTYHSSGGGGKGVKDPAFLR